MSVRCSCMLVCLLVIVGCGIADPISFIKKCKPSDAKCHKDSAQAALPTYALGVPELGIEALDPLHISKLDASDAGLELVITDATITGIKGCRVKKLARDLEKSRMAAKVQCDLALDGQYKMKGRLLLLPIEGNGPVHVKLPKIVLGADAVMEERVGKDGKNHWHIKSWTHDFELKAQCEVVFENLFPNNAVLGQAARDLVAQNGNDIISTVGRPVIKSVLSKVLSNVNKFFAHVAYEDIVDTE